jgi:hypothetical protein
MGLKHEFNKIADNVKDTVSEAHHRSDAEGEQAKRDVAGDTMTPGEKLGSDGRALARAPRTRKTRERSGVAFRHGPSAQRYLRVAGLADRSTANAVGRGLPNANKSDATAMVYDNDTDIRYDTDIQQKSPRQRTFLLTQHPSRYGKPTRHLNAPK